MFRWLGWNVWYDWYDISYKHNLTPFLQDQNGLYILTSRNDKYWEIVERMIQIANYPSQKSFINAPGITIWFDLFYQYRNDADDIKKSPWRNNTHGFTDLYDSAQQPFIEAYMLEWFKLKKKGLKIEFGIGNELLGDSLEFCNRVLRVMDREKIWPFSWGICPEIPLIGNALFKKSLDTIRNENLFLWYPIRNAGNSWEASIKRPVHHVGRPYNGIDVLQSILDNWGQNPIGKIASDDGCMGSTGKPNASEWAILMERILTYNGNTNAITKQWMNIDHPYFGIEHLPDDEPWDICREKQLLLFDTIAKVYAQYVEPFENYGKWPIEYIKPECKIGDVIKKTCWDGSEIIVYYCDNGKWKLTGIVCPIKPSHKCGIDKWYQHFKKTWNFKAAFDHLLGKHNW
jgi:hypothetical protein